MGHCRLCHGKFSSRSLRSISGRASGENTERPPSGERIFIRDFQRLLGVAIHQDPALSSFVCKNCHTQFYQCHGLLQSFLQKVNMTPSGPRKPCTKTCTQPLTGSEEGACMVDLMSPSTQGLCGLVGWVHGHATSCGTLPSLQRTLSSEYCGILQAVWGCDQGHHYTMDTDANRGAFLLDNAVAVKWAWDKERVPGLTQQQGSSPTCTDSQSPPSRAAEASTKIDMQPSTDTGQSPSDGSPLGPGPGPLPQLDVPPTGFSGQLGENQVPSSTSDDRVKDEFSDLSEG